MHTISVSYKGRRTLRKLSAFVAEGARYFVHYCDAETRELYYA